MSQNIRQALEAAAARSGCGHHDLDRFAGHLENLAPYRAARINPFEFAEEAGMEPETAVDLFVHGAKLGVFDLEWGMICPLCGGITNSVAQLDLVAEDQLFCKLCDRPSESVLDDTVEVSFAYAAPGTSLDLHSDFTTYQHYYTSSSYPHRDDWRSYHERHTIGDLRLEPGQTAEMMLNLRADEAYRLLCLDTHSGAELITDRNGPDSADLILGEEGFSADVISLSAGNRSLALTNQTDQSVWCRVLERDMDDLAAIFGKGPARFGRRLTGKHLLNNQAFRDSFAVDDLAPDLRLKLRSLTLLFTDLKGSTALYDREGDIAAYRLVQDHFSLLKKVVRSHSGAVIKTMGDAIMAAFPSGNDGAAAAIAMMGEMQKLSEGHRQGEVGLKVGLHAGPALAINAGTNLDYFGQTVNIAARVQGMADAGEICLTRALYDDGGVPDLLTQSGFSGVAEITRLKGVTAEEQVYRYRTAP